MLNRFRNRYRKNRAVTLMESVLVVLIMAVVAATVYFNVKGVNNDSVAASCATDKAAMETAQQVYFAQKGSYATSETQLVDAQLLGRASTMHDVNAAGEIVNQAGSKCATA